MALEMEAMAAAIGVSVPVLRFLLCFAATIPVSFLWRLVPGGPLARHLYAGVSGAVLSCLAFGATSNLHFLFPMAIGYASMRFCRRHCGVFTFFACFGYLIFCHAYYMSGDAWKEGGIDATGALMVLVLKVISCAINYSDGILAEEGLRNAQKKHRLIHCPSLVEYLGYCLCCGSHFAGPVYEMKDYLEWTEQKGIWSPEEPSVPSPYSAALRVLVQAAICMGIYLKLVPQFPLSRFGEPIYQEWGFWQRLWYQYMSGFTARWKYYFIWSISEASLIISGFGFSGWSSSTPPKPQWERAKNVDIIGVELATSAVALPLVWNIQVSTWLRYYVYDRLIPKGKKPGFLQLLATQTVSAIWHPERTIHGLDPVVVAAFPTISYNKETFSSRGYPQCSICLAEYEEKEILRIMPTCGHNFHVPCIDEWLLKQSTCPVCRLSLHDSYGSRDALAFLHGVVPQIVDVSEYSMNRSRNWSPHRNEQSQGSRNTLEIDGAVRIDMQTTGTGLTEHC